MKRFFHFVFLFLSYSLKAQFCCDEGAIIMLHPSIGYTITMDAKKKFSLFPQYNDSIFESAQLVKYNDSSFTFLFNTKYDVKIELPISVAKLSAMYADIEMIEPVSSAVQTFFNPKKTRQRRYLSENEMEDEDRITDSPKKGRQQTTSDGYSTEFGVVMRDVLYVVFETMKVLSKASCK